MTPVFPFTSGTILDIQGYEVLLGARLEMHRLSHPVLQFIHTSEQLVWTPLHFGNVWHLGSAAYVRNIISVHSLRILEEAKNLRAG